MLLGKLREMEELLRKEIEKANGNFNDGKIIDIDDMGELVKDVENMDIEGKNKNKKYKEKDIGMDLDEVIGNKRHVIKKINYPNKKKWQKELIQSVINTI